MNAGDQLPPVHAADSHRAAGVRRRFGDTDTALRLSRAFGGSAQFWMNMQTLHDLAVARETAGAALDAIPRLNPKAA